MSQMHRSGGAPAVVSDNSDAVGDCYDAAILYARKRKFSDAENSLREATERGDCTEVEALDLRARIRVQQGRLLEAESDWSKAIALDGANSAYQQALAALRQGNLTARRCPAIAVASGTLLLVTLGLGALALSHTTGQQIEDLRKSLVQLDAHAAAASEGTLAEIRELKFQVDGLSKTVAQASDLAKLGESGTASALEQVKALRSDVGGLAKSVAQASDLAQIGDALGNDVARQIGAVNVLQRAIHDEFEQTRVDLSSGFVMDRNSWVNANNKLGDLSRKIDQETDQWSWHSANYRQNDVTKLVEAIARCDENLVTDTGHTISLLSANNYDKTLFLYYLSNDLTVDFAKKSSLQLLLEYFMNPDAVLKATRCHDVDKNTSTGGQLAVPYN